MSLIHGEAIDAEKVERIVSREFTAQGFASLCNAIAWASAGRRCSSLPSFTERVTVKDGGIDAEWQTEFPDDQQYLSPLFGPGWNVFQYKQRDIFAQDRDQTFSNLKSGVKGAIRELYTRTGRRPDRYVLFTNPDLTHQTKAEKAAVPQKGELKKSILENYDQADKVHVEIVGAAELSSLLNNLPHLRSAFFSISEFCSWQQYREDFSKEKLYGGHVELIGRDDELADLRVTIDDPTIRTIVLTGPHNIGKTRLALEATSHRPIETVIALDPLSMSVKDLLALRTPGREVVVIIEDPDSDKIELFVKRTLPETDLKLLLTVPTAETSFLPNFGEDTRIKVFPLEPLSEAHAQELLKAAGATFDYNLESWLMAQTGGNPGLLLLASSLGPELRETATSFTEKVAKALEHKIDRRFDKTTIESLRLLSLLTQVGIRGSVFEEVENICVLFGDDVQPNTILNNLECLTKAGIVQERGSYVEVVPPLLANYLAASALKGRFSELVALLAVLSQPARWRLLKRLRSVTGDETTRLWNELLGDHGLFHDVPSLLAHGELLRVIAGAVPEKLWYVVEKGLKQMSVEERLAINKEDRKTLVHALEVPLFRQRTCTTALQCLFLLAETEEEDSGHDAAELFSEYFCFWHPDVPLSLQERLRLLDDMFPPESSLQLQMLRIQAIRAGLSRGQLIFCRTSSGPKPLDSRTIITNEELCHYLETLVGFLLETAHSPEPALARYAASAVPQALVTLTQQISPESGVKKFELVTDWTLTHQVPISVSDLSHALKYIRHWLNEYIGKFDSDTDKRLEKNIEHIENCIQRLHPRDVQGDFATRLQRWAGRWERYDHEEVIDEAGNSLPRGKKELRTLAEEAIRNPELLSDSLVTWFCSKEAAFGHLFWGWLGVLDSKQAWFTQAESIGAHENRTLAFANYCGALSQTDRQSVITRLGELAETHRVTPKVIVTAMRFLGSKFAAVESMETLIREKQVDAAFIEHLLHFEDTVSLSSNEFLQILKRLAEPNLSNAGVIIEFFKVWFWNERPIEGELAEFGWQCLESIPVVSSEVAEVCDQLAATLTQSDAERGFRLLEKLLRQPGGSRSWNPIYLMNGYKFWNGLRQTDPERTLRLALQLALKTPYSLANRHLGIINQESDADVLITFAYEGEEQAKLISRHITTEESGFWPIAFGIIEKYPYNLTIRSNLSSGVEQKSWSGSRSVHLENRRKSVTQILNQTSTPTVARPWLQELEASLRERAEQWLLSETTERLNDWKTAADNPAASEQLWAITMLFHLNKLEFLHNLISKNELLTLLPHLQLSNTELKEIQRQIEAWK